MFTVPAAFAQQRMGTVLGQVTDNVTGDPVVGALVEMRSMADSTLVKTQISDGGSKFSVSGLPYGQYTMRITFLGYEPVERTILVNARNINISHVFLIQSVTDIEQVNVVAQAMRTSQNGDTLIYNAHAFKVSDDADADELLRQLPGVEVGRDGTVKAQGKDVQKIFVDGKETFGTDVATTMKNIPANIIDKVEVYNKLSDFAETTGINDGDDYQVMNFVTGVTFAQFGTFSGLYGIEDKYGLDARYNVVTGNHGFMLDASADNTGSGGGGFGGFGGFGGAGVEVIGMMGGGGYGSRFGDGGGMSANNKSSSYNTALNYNYGIEEKLRLSLNYRFGHRDNERKSESDRSYLNTSAFDDLYNRSTAIGKSNSINNNHRFGGNVEWRITPKQRINLRFDGSYSNGNSGDTNETNQFTDVVENLFQYYSSRGKNHSESYDFNVGMNYGLRFDKEGRSLTVGLNAGKNKDDGNSSNDTHMIIPSRIPPLDSLGRSRTVNDSDSWNLRARVQFSEPLSDYWSLMSVYEFSYRLSDRNSSSDKWDYTDDFEVGSFVPWNEGSNILETRDLSHRIGPGVYYSKNSNMLRLDFVYKYTKQEMDRTLPLPRLKDDVNFNNFVYNAMYRMQLTPQKRMEFQLEADTRNPSISQLQEVDNISSSSIYVSSGNADLKPYYSHRGSISYNTNNIVRASYFSVTVNGTLTMDHIGTRTTIVTDDQWTTPNGTVIEKGGQYSRPENMNKSSWSFGAFTSYSRPLNFIKSTLDLSGNFNYNESPGYINDEENTARTQSYSFAANLSSNWSTDLTMFMTYSFSPAFTRNTHKDYDRSSSLNHMLSFYGRWETWLDFVLSANLDYANNLTRQKGARDYRFENTQCTVSLGKKVFRNKRGEVTFTVNDLFNQNAYSSQRIQPNYIENVVDKGIGRYFSIEFTYRLRDFVKNGQSVRRGDRRPDRLNRNFGGRRMRGFRRRG